MVIDVAEVQSVYDEHGKNLVLDFSLHQITDFLETEMYSLESLVRQTFLARDASAPFNDIWYLEKTEPEFWTGFKMTEVFMMSIATKVLKKDIGVNIGKSGFSSMGTMAKAKGWVVHFG